MSLRDEKIVRIGDRVRRTQQPMLGREAIIVGGPTAHGCYEVAALEDKSFLFSFNWHPGNFIIIKEAKPNWEI